MIMKNDEDENDGKMKIVIWYDINDGNDNDNNDDNNDDNRYENEK